MEKWIEQYTADMPAGHWEVIGQFVRDAVRDSLTDEDKTPLRRTKEHLKVCARMVHWAWQVAGLDLDRSVIFRREVIAEFIAHGCAHLMDSTRGTHRTRLYKMSDALLGAPTALTAAETISRTPYRSLPLTGDEVTLLRQWAEFQRTDYRRVNATILLALGLGAGLRTGEIIALTAGDVHVDTDGVVLSIKGEKPRQVPVLATWEQPIADLAGTAMRADLHLFSPRRRTGNPNVVSSFIQYSHNVPFRLTAQRMRATWVVGRLTAGTPLNALIEAGDFDSAATLGRYVTMMPALETAQVRAALRGGLHGH